MAPSVAGYFNAKTPVKRSEALRLADLDINADHDASADWLHRHRAGKNADAKAALLGQHEHQFATWAFELREGFSLLMFGFGSKRALLERFAHESLTDGAVLAVNGLLPTATVRQLMQHAAALMCKLPSSGVKGLDLDSLLGMIQRDASDQRMYVILHNIDGPGFRSAEAQAMLSRLASCEQVHLVASFDHVNTPLLWDKRLAARFNWLWHDVTTYAPYTAEVAAAALPSLLVGRSTQVVESGAVIVLRAMVPKAREVFRIIVEQQSSEEGGVDFHRLFKLCRDQFLVGVEANLKAHLTEFRDHQLLQIRRGADGNDLFYVPLPADTLQSILKEVSD